MISRTQRCEWKGCGQRYELYVSLEAPGRMPVWTVYVCRGHLSAATAYANQQRSHNPLAGSRVVLVDLLTW